ncbi:hypothetical protein K458DRAFT_483506 [Lentithecium fluviatile CBS 122367]|uniref:C3H1-type domain-containing protein n=1 Tax=Lentithecium fluviatile CBS 122367 TaxID=1168545 RepID=A0A6G1JHE4_9PLEO|nr:hypothetical protein K458DRAFT_483506 [Lentithecium fluviatile CBS 122367]
MDSNEAVQVATEMRKLVEENKRFTESYHESLQNLLTKLEALETRTRQEASKQRAGNDPYVAILIDGTAFNHQIQDEDLQCNRRSGRGLAQRLQGFIKGHLHGSAPTISHDSRIVVRIYADFKALTWAVVQAKPVDLNSQGRALTPFAAGFNEVDELYDFVDVGDEQFVRAKVCANFRQFHNDPNCKKIIFGVGLVPTYADTFGEPPITDKRVVLLRLGQMATKYEELGMSIIEFPEVFRSSPQPDESNSSDPSSTIFNPTRNRLLNRAQGRQQPPESEDCLDNLPWRVLNRQPLPQANPLNHATHTQSQQPTIRHTDTHEKPPSNLPASRGSGLVPLNAYNHRIDTYLRTATPDEHAAFRARVRIQRACYPFQIRGFCPSPDCQDDHEPYSEMELRALRCWLRSRVCRKGGACRWRNCWAGHHCQKQRCLQRNSRTDSCKMPNAFHGVNLEVVRWVHAEDEPTRVSVRQSEVESTEETMTADGDDVSISYDGNSVPVTYDLIDLS